MNGKGRHYERAFEDFLAVEGLTYTPVTVLHRSAFRRARLKSFDFVVWPCTGENWLVDVKGRVSRTPRLENWVTRSDLEGLLEWEEVFGRGFVGVLVFAYWVRDPQRWTRVEAPLHEYDGRFYSFWAVHARDYAAKAKVRSGRWQTLTVPGEVFLQICRPLACWLTCS